MNKAGKKEENPLHRETISLPEISINWAHMRNVWQFCNIRQIVYHFNVD